MSRRPPPKDRNSDKTLGARLREETGEPWNAVKKLISTGKIFVDGKVIVDPGYRPAPHHAIEIRQRAQKPKRNSFEIKIVHQDKHLIVIDKPSGVSSVPYHGDERDTAMDLVREAWRSRGETATGPLIVVHRIDKDTSGLLVFARSKRGEIGIGRQLRDHTMQRQYLCVVNGHATSGRHESYFLRDRGDGLRGSNRHDDKGKLSITLVEVEETWSSASLCRVRLETGRTHQIRIHLSEAGHPLVGDRVYSRDFNNAGRELITSPRLLLHAQTLGFEHPVSGEQIAFRSELPDDFTQMVKTLKR